MRTLPAVTFLFIITVFLATACNSGFDEATMPADQIATEMAFKRMSEHGAVEPVLEVGQPFTEWQFLASPDLLVINDISLVLLSDRSNIRYEALASDNDPKIMERLRAGVLGYATGEVVGVDRDLARGRLTARLRIDAWRPRALELER